MPDSLEWYASRFMQWRSRLNRLAGPLVRGFLPDLEIVDIIQDLSGRLRELRTALTDATRSSYRLVLTPDQAVLKEAQRAETYLNLFEYPIDALVINRVFPADVAGNEYLQVLKDRQEHMLAAVNMSFPTLPAFSAPLMAREPVGLQALSAFATEVFGHTDPSAILHLGPTQTYEETPHGVMLRIPMPNVELSKLSLTKRGDELYVEVGAFRRLIPLPVSVAALKPQAAKMRSGFLEIPFVSAAGET
jgi:arsenite-transporting ATPase